jgi:tRNA-specific adenosine deaminase 3
MDATQDNSAAGPSSEVCQTPEPVEASAPPKTEHRGPSEILSNPLIDDLKEGHTRRGVLIPLKTTQEVRQDHTITHAYITRAPTKQANDVITYAILQTLTVPNKMMGLILTTETI